MEWPVLAEESHGLADMTFKVDLKMESKMCGYPTANYRFPQRDLNMESKMYGISL